MSARSARRSTLTAATPRERRRARRGAKAAPLRTGPLLKPSARIVAETVDAVPDLLALQPRLGVDAGELCGALDFAFAGGSCPDALEEAFAQCALPASEFNPDCFADDLFLEELVATCMRPEGVALDESFLVRVLSQPPSDVAVIDFRRAILQELEDDALRADFHKLHRSLASLRTLWSTAAPSSRFEATHRRIDMLALLRGVFELASTAFARTTSGLGRIHDFGREVVQSRGFADLVELLDYENELAKVDVRMQLGIDGRVRKFEIVHLAENAQNRFYTTPLGRWLGKIVMWWRGYRFSNDELVDRWLNHVFEGVSHFLPALVQLLGHVEVYVGALAFRDRCVQQGLPVCFPELGSGPRRMRGLFNPLLFAQGVVPIPCDIGGDAPEAITIVTGPNSGGKTRLLQAIGLTQLLAQSGMYAPVAEARMPLASGMYVSVIDEPSADQKEGRLGTELIRIRDMFETSRAGALVILDELCSGTNPSEGEEIFYLVLTLLSELAPEAFITTHFLSFARRLASADEALELAFLQVELDAHQRPTYGFVPGVATTSLAAQTAARLGVTREELMALVRQKKR